MDTVRKVIAEYINDDKVNDDSEFFKSYIDLSYSRVGQDVRYALNDDKLRSLGWKPKIVFDKVISSITKYYKENFIW